MNSRPDLNCDLGEGESPDRTAALMAHLDSANIACGGHAGSDESMRTCLALAHRFGIHAGAHPGIPDPENFGRDPARRIEPATFRAWLIDQVGRLATLARISGVALHHIKLHGALYHATDARPDLAETYLHTVSEHWPECLVYARAGGPVMTLARRQGRPAWGEAFLDRGYQSNGELVPRTQPGALLQDPRHVQERIDSLQRRGGWESTTGDWIPLDAQTLCVHGDSEIAESLLGAARSRLGPRATA